MKKKILLAICLLTVMLLACACGKDDKKKTNDKEVTATPSAGGAEKGVFLMKDADVKKIGRTALIKAGVKDNREALLLSYSGSGIEFEFTGKSCVIELRRDSMDEENHMARYGVYVDGEEKVKALLKDPTEFVEVVKSDKAETHVIKLIKLSETSDSSMGIMEIKCDEEATIKATPEKDLKIEFVGDSITCGYGVEDPLGKSYMTGNENCTKAYAYKTAEKLGADYSLVSKSGHGIITGYTTNDVKQEKQLMSLYYNSLGDSYGTFAYKKINEIEWDFSQFVPDVIVINLGTNDNSYTKNFDDRKEDYIVNYVKFLKQIREKNPDAKIVCVLGVMGQELFPQIQETVKRYTEETGDSEVYSFKLDVQNANANGYAVDYHPVEASHEHAAQQMAEFLEDLLK